VVALPLTLGCVFFARPALGKGNADVSRCQECHAEETTQWKASPHARAVGERFLTEWRERGKKWECIVCHASEYDRLAGTFSSEGVACASCHGTPPENHPMEGQMALPVTSDVCRSCHAVTYAEWRISAHGQKNIRCFDCHKMHRMELRKDDPDEMCGTCHPARLKDFAHATHRIKGLHCISCHMPEPVGVHLKIMGTGVRGHSYGVGAETCAQCHREMVHESHEVASLQEQVQRFREATPEELTRKAADLEQKVESQREILQANRRVLPWILISAFILGGFFGIGLLQMTMRKRKRNGGERPTQRGEPPSERP
jgi:hypothetical protein